MELREWETIKSTPGGYLGWGRKPGQNVIGYVAEYSIDEGTDFGGNKCPHLVLELTEDTVSFNKDGDQAEYQSGEFINITCGQASLKSAIRRTDPSPGDLMRITLTDLVKTANGTAKVFEVQIARGAKKVEEPVTVADKGAKAPF